MQSQIDLSKSVRLKSNHDRVGKATLGERFLLIEWEKDGGYVVRSPSEFYSDFENVPEEAPLIERWLVITEDGQEIMYFSAQQAHDVAILYRARVVHLREVIEP